MNFRKILGKSLKSRQNQAMGRRPLSLIFLLIVLIVAALTPNSASAHRDPCHLWHSCDSDVAAYVCGDLGIFDQCTGMVLPAPVNISVAGIAGGPEAAINTYPTDGQVLNAKVPITLTWSVENSDEPQQIMVTRKSPTSDGLVSSTDLVQSFHLIGNEISQAITGELPAGRYWWVVKLMNADSGAIHFSKPTSFTIRPRVRIPRIRIVREGQSFGLVQIVVRSESNVDWTRTIARLNGRQPPSDKVSAATDTQYVDSFFFNKPHRIRTGAMQRLTVWLRGKGYVTKRTIRFRW